MAKLITIFLLIILNINCAGCPYSFTGSSVPSHLKTIAIPLLDDQSNFGEPGLRENMTRAITEKFISDNSLSITDKNSANSILNGTILRVTDKPISLSNAESFDQKRVEITVKVTFMDMIKKKKVWEKEFSNWGDYKASGGISNRSEGIKAAIEKLSEDILLQTVSGW